MTASIEQRTAQYVHLRDIIKEQDDAHKKKMEPMRKLLDDLNVWLHNELKTLGIDKVSSDAGTVYITSKKSASIADLEAFWNFVVANQAFDLIDKKANATAVEEFAKHNKQLPPGINFSQVNVVGVRRPNEKAD